MTQKCCEGLEQLRAAAQTVQVLFSAPSVQSLAILARQVTSAQAQQVVGEVSLA